MSESHFLSADMTPATFVESLDSFAATTADDPQRWLWLTADAGWSLDAWRGLSESVNWYQAGCLRNDASDVARQRILESSEGRLFDAKGEVRWQNIGSSSEPLFRVVAISSGEIWEQERRLLRSAPGVEVCNARALGVRRRSESTQLALWGRQSPRTPGEWIELKIPHRFKYPVSQDNCNAESIAIDCETWEDDLGQVHFVCFRGLVDATEFRPMMLDHTE